MKAKALSGMLYFILVSAIVPTMVHTQSASTLTVATQHAFDVVSIKPNTPNTPPAHGWAGVQYHPDGLEFAWQSVPELLYYAFGLGNGHFDGQITGLPSWTDSQKYDIVAKMSPEDIEQFKTLSGAQQQQWRQQMVQAFLIERFNLAFHSGVKQVPVYDLVVAKGGIKMRDATTDPDAPLGRKEDGTAKQGIRWQKDSSVVQAYPMQAWVQFLSSPSTGVGRPVVDKTGLLGSYNFSFDWSVYSARISVHNGVAMSDPAEDGPSIFKAIDEIGLKLQPSTASMPTLIVDHVEQPTPN